jgi:hypothetical protein
MVEETRFRQALASMEHFFRDPLPPQHQTQYWLLLRDVVTIDEWEYAAQEAQRRETFYRVPLPAHLMDYVREYRQAQRREVA